MVLIRTPDRIFSARHIGLLAVCWCASFFTLLNLTKSSNIPVSAISDTDISQLFPLPENESGAFSIVFHDPDNPLGPDYSFRFDHLKVTNAKVGLFHTALCQQMTLTDAAFNVYSYSGIPAHSAVISSRNKPAVLTTDFAHLRDQLSDGIRSLPDVPNAVISLPDMSQTIRVNIDQFHFNWLFDNREQLTIHSQRAFLVAENADQLTLRGAVRISTPDSTMQGNHVVWDIEKQRFYVKGSCVLTIRHQKQFGRDLCFDADLNILTPSREPAKKGDALCYVTDAY
jgi:hypothetical protein